MGIIDRILLMLYTLSLTVLSAAFVAVASGWRVPLDYVRTSLDNPSGRWSIAGTSFLFFIASVRFIIYVFTPGRSRRAVVHETEMGEVHIALDAIENLVKRATRQVRGVRAVRAKVATREGGLAIYLRIVVSPDVSIPEASEEIRSTLKSYVKNVVGVPVLDIPIEVDDISADSRRRPE